LRRHAKFGRNRSNRCRDMTIFRFFQDGGRPPSWIRYVCVRTTHDRRVFGGLYRCAKFGWNGCSSFDNMQACFSISRVWLENAYSRLRNGVLGGFDPLNGGYLIAIPKRH